MGQSCCAGRSFKVHLKYCLRSCKHTLRVMTMTGFWQLIQKWKMGCTWQRYALQGRIEFPSLSMCQNGSESVRNVSSWSEAEWWMDGLLCAGRGKAGVGPGMGRYLPGLKHWEGHWLFRVMSDEDSWLEQTRNEAFGWSEELVLQLPTSWEVGCRGRYCPEACC